MTAHQICRPAPRKLLFAKPTAPDCWMVGIKAVGPDGGYELQDVATDLSTADAQRWLDARRCAMAEGGASVSAGVWPR